MIVVGISRWGWPAWWTRGLWGMWCLATRRSWWWRCSATNPPRMIIGWCVWLPPSPGGVISYKGRCCGVLVPPYLRSVCWGWGGSGPEAVVRLWSSPAPEWGRPVITSLPITHTVITTPRGSAPQGANGAPTLPPTPERRVPAITAPPPTVYHITPLPPGRCFPPQLPPQELHVYHSVSPVSISLTDLYPVSYILHPTLLTAASLSCYSPPRHI